MKIQGVESLLSRCWNTPQDVVFSCWGKKLDRREYILKYGIDFLVSFIAISSEGGVSEEPHQKVEDLTLRSCSYCDG